MRRCVRVEKNEGRLLEDLGIHPDLVYHMTLRDVMEKNQDLNIRASLELSRMPAYDLDVAVVPKDSAYTLVCRTLQLTSVEAFAGEMFLAAAPATDGKPVELSIISGRGSVEVRGLRDNRVVARRFVSLPAPSA